MTEWQAGVVVATAGEELANQQRAQAALVDARDAVERTMQALDSRPMHPDELREAVAGAVTAVEALTTVVGHLVLHAPVALAGHEGKTEQVVADLRALHGCLITGARLAAPTLDDLQTLPATDRSGQAQRVQHATEHGQSHADRPASAPA